jgi:transcriptional regulator with XRE-family HTH domain
MNNHRYVSVSHMVKWGQIKEIPTPMEEKNRIRLGKLLRARREALGLSTRKLEELSGVTGATIVRIEQGEFAAPAPDKLARIADVLGIPLADVYAVAEYAAPQQLPNLSPYLRTKYRDLPDEAAAQIEAYAQRLATKHGVDLRGPAPGEDEDEELKPNAKRTPRSVKRTGTKTKSKTKGGTK